MDKQRLVIAGVGVAILVVLGLGFVFGVQPQLSAASAASDQAATIQANNQTSEAQLAKLKQDYSNIDQFSGQLSDLKRSIPASPSLDELLADLRSLAASTGTTISGFNPGQAVAYTPPAAPVTAAPTAGSTASPSPTPTPTAAAPAKPQAPKTTTNSLITASNFVAIPLTISVTGTTDGAIAFLGALQHGSRLVLVTGFSGSEDKSGGASGAAASGATWTINGLVYVLSGAQPAATPTPSK